MRLRFLLSLALITGLAACGDAASDRPAGPDGFSWHETPKPVPDLAFVNGAGADQRLSDYRGKVVLLNLWATWCPPCLEEMPSLDALASAKAGADFTVVALSLDRQGVAAVESFYDKAGIAALPIAVDKSMQAMASLGLEGLPTTLLIDRQGRELGRLAGDADWDSPEARALIRASVAE